MEFTDEMYRECRALINQCNDVRTLRAMLLDTLENAKNAAELTEDLMFNYFDQE